MMLRSILAAILIVAAVPHAAAQQSTPDSLIGAVYREDAEAVARALQNPWIVAQELNPECPPQTRCKPITYAAEQQDTTILKLLLEAGADPNGTNSMGDNGLIMAIMSGNREGIDLLLAYGGDVNQGNRFGITPYTGAVMMGEHTLVRKFLAAGANPNQGVQLENGPNAPSGTILTLAVQMGHIEVVRVLLECGASPAIADELGRLPADYADELNLPEIAALLRTRA